MSSRRRDTGPDRRRPLETPPAVETYGIVETSTGIVLWAVALALTVVFRHRLAQQGHTTWMWTCLAGIGLGLLGLDYLRHRRRKLLDVDRVRFRLARTAARPAVPVSVADEPTATADTAGPATQVIPRVVAAPPPAPSPGLDDTAALLLQTRQMLYELDDPGPLPLADIRPQSDRFVELELDAEDVDSRDVGKHRRQQQAAPPDPAGPGQSAG